MKPGAIFDTSILVLLVVLVYLFKRLIGQGSSRSSKFFVDISLALAFTCSVIWKWIHDQKVDE